MNRRTFIISAIAAPAVAITGTSALAAELPRKIQYKYHLIFDNVKHFSLAKSHLRSGAIKEQVEKNSYYMSDGTVHLYMNSHKPTFKNQFLLPLSLTYTASKIEDLETGKILKNRYN
jgi:hypothetical protein